MNVIKSISFDQFEILNNILDLHCGTRQIDVDMCYGHGCFYKNGLPKPTHCYEINPVLAEKFNVTCGDCTNLPLESNSQGIVILDGAYGIGSGGSLDVPKKGQNITPGRFTCTFYQHCQRIRFLLFGRVHSSG